MRKFGIKLFFFSILLVALLWSASTLFTHNFRKEPDMGAMEAFYDLEENSLDVLLVGSSHCYCGFDPRVLLDEYEISGYNLASGNQTMLANYLWAKEAYQTQKYKTLVVEVYSLYTVSEEDMAIHLKALYAMRPSKTYFEYADYVGKKRLLTLAFPIFELHDQWPVLSKEAFLPLDKTIIENRGYYGIHEGSVAGEEYSASVLQEDTEEMDAANFKRADDIREFCEENNIQLIFVKAIEAKNSENIWDDSRHNAVANYCEQYGIPFFDFNSSYYMEQAGLHPDTDVSADRCHANEQGAGKETRLLGEYLKNSLQNS